MTMSKFTSTLISFALMVALLVQTTEAATACHICGGRGNSAMKFPNISLQGVGKSCQQIALEVAGNTAYGSSSCSAKQSQWASRCCSGNKPAGTSSSGGLPPQNIPKVTYVGPNPVCKLCRNGDYPYATSMVINFLYIGEGSCAQYYRYGLEGRIQNHMCDPVKFFAYEPCGCGEFNPYYNKNHPLNQQANQAPQQNNNNNNGNNNNNQNQQRQPYGENKDNQSMRGNRGGSGGRRLKGASVVTEETSTNSVVVVEV